MLLQEARKPSSVAAGALHCPGSTAGRSIPSKFQQLLVARTIRHHLHAGNNSAGRVYQRRAVGVFVCVDPDDAVDFV
jgi:hypothetical protein